MTQENYRTCSGRQSKVSHYCYYCLFLLNSDHFLCFSILIFFFFYFSFLFFFFFFLLLLTTVFLIKVVCNIIETKRGVKIIIKKYIEPILYNVYYILCTGWLYIHFIYLIFYYCILFICTYL